MNPPNPVIVPGDGNESAAPRLRSVVRKSALLNLVMIAGWTDLYDGHRQKGLE
jgi:hypothetical protein